MVSKELETHELEHIPDTFYYKCTVCGIYLIELFTDDGFDKWVSIEQQDKFKYAYFSKIVSCNEYLMQKALM